MLRIFIRDLKLDIVIGVYDHEKLAPQEIILNLEATVNHPENFRADNPRTVVDYAEVADRIRQVVARRSPVQLLETIGGFIGEELMKDRRISDLRVTIEKPGALPDARSAGITLHFPGLPTSFGEYSLGGAA